MKKYLRHALTALAMLLTAATLYPSPLGIQGAGLVSCTPAEESYGPSGLLTGQAGAAWLWEVSGGTFADGGTALEQAPVTVRWGRADRPREGKLSLRVVKDGETVATATLTVYLGPPEPLGITLEDAPLACDGNWFQVRTAVPLTAGETVEWLVKNGLGADGRPVRLLRLGGGEGHRVFLKREDLARPIEVSASILSGCGQASRQEGQVFREPPVRLSGPRVVEGGQEATFFVCQRPGTGRDGTDWDLPGSVTGTGDGSVTVYFPPGSAARTERVALTLTDCSGNGHTLSAQVEVLPPTKGIPVGQGAAALDGGLDFRAFPNPSVHGTLNVEVREPSGEVRVELIGLHGRILASKVSDGGLTSLQTGGLPPGIYLLRVSTPDKEAVTRVNINLF